MRWVLAFLAFGLGAWALYGLGYRQGMTDAPAYAEAKREQREAFDEWAAAADAEPTHRDRVCDQIIEDVRELLATEYDLTAPQ